MTVDRLQHAIPLEERVRFRLLLAFLDDGRDLREVTRAAGMTTQRAHQVFMAGKRVSMKFLASWCHALGVEPVMRLVPIEGER